MPTRWASVVLVIALFLPHVEPPFQVTFPTDPGRVEFVSSFGFPRSGGRRHQGNDLMAAKMTPVFAVADGLVVTVKVGRTPGRYVKLDHGDGWSSYYMHLNNDTPGTDDGDAPLEAGITVSEGQTVVAGELIGYVGDSGNAEGTDPHLHFELRRGGRAVDPYRALVEARNRAIVDQIRLAITRYWESSTKNLEFVLNGPPG